MEDNSIIRLEQGGQWYTGHYRVERDTVHVTQGHATIQANRQGLPARALADQLLFAMVVRKGQGLADRTPTHALPAHAGMNRSRRVLSA